MNASIAVVLVMLLSLSVVSILIMGEYLAGKFKKSKFYKWWRKNVIMEVDDNYPG
jgi:hypothetical protein